VPIFGQLIWRGRRFSRYYLFFSPKTPPYAAPKIVSPRLDPLSACPQKAERAVATLFRGAT